MRQDNKPKRVFEDSEKVIRWEDDEERLILYADIMGFSERVTHSEHEILKETLYKFRESWQTRIKPLKARGHLKSSQFSDSILLVVNGTNWKMFNIITKAAVCLMQCALSQGIPLKGVIAQGKFSYDKKNELYFGLPLIDAYRLHNEICYYGIVVHHSAEQTVKNYADSTKPYTKALVCLKSGKTSHYHLSWHRLNLNLKSGNIKDDVNKWLDKIEESVSGAPRIYVDNTRDVIEKDDKVYENVGEAGILD